jgi:hypothetical protein
MEEENLYDKSIENTYEYLIEKRTFEDIYLENNPGDLHIFFGDVIDQELENEEINEMISYYESTEEYEKCHKLKQLKR